MHVNISFRLLVSTDCKACLKILKIKFPLWLQNNWVQSLISDSLNLLKGCVDHSLFSVLANWIYLWADWMSFKQENYKKSHTKTKYRKWWKIEIWKCNVQTRKKRVVRNEFSCDLKKKVWHLSLIDHSSVTHTCLSFYQITTSKTKNWN